MAELLLESYQNGIYWACINAERAKEKAAEAELEYWTLRMEKEGLVAGVECADRKISPVGAGIGDKSSSPTQGNP